MKESREQSGEPVQPAFLPGLAGIALWMMILSAIGAFGVVLHHFPPLVLVLSALFALGSLGLLKLRRWGWALALALAFLSMTFGVYSIFRFHQLQTAVLAVVNVVFFLYLVRPEVIGRLR
jgi:uncharacterized membrane protein (DUF2068 family)